MQQVAGHIQGCDNGNAVQADYARRIARFAHLGIQDLGRVEQVGSLIGRAFDGVFFVENSDAYLGVLFCHIRIPAPSLSACRSSLRHGL